MQGTIEIEAKHMNWGTISRLVKQALLAEGAAACLFFACALCPIRRCQSSDLVLEKLSEYDLLYSAGMSASGTARVVSGGIWGKTKAYRKSWAISVEGQAVAVVGHYELPEQVYIAPDSDASKLKGKSHIEHSSDKTMTCSFLEHEAISFEPDRAARVDVSGVFTIDANGRLLSSNRSWARMHYPPGDSTLAVPYLSALWACGRGFASHIKSVTEVEEAGSGEVAVVANGFGFTENSVGTWRLIVNTREQYLVTSGSFVKASQSKPFFRFENAGTTRSGDAVFPSKAEFEIVDLQKVTSFSLENFALQPDPEVRIEAKRLVTETGPGESVTMDHAVVPPKVTYADSSRSQGEATASGLKPGTRFRVLMFVNLLLLVVGIVWWAFRSRRWYYAK